MAPVGAFMAAYGGAVATGLQAAASGYSIYSQNVQARQARGAREAAMALAATQNKERPQIKDIVPTIVPTTVSDPAQREADAEAQIMTNRRRMASYSKRKTVATSSAGITKQAAVEKKTLLGQTGALSLGVV
jgi:hypothetical protein